MRFPSVFSTLFIYFAFSRYRNDINNSSRQSEPISSLQTMRTREVRFLEILSIRILISIDEVDVFRLKQMQIRLPNDLFDSIIFLRASYNGCSAACFAFFHKFM